MLAFATRRCPLSRKQMQDFWQNNTLFSWAYTDRLVRLYAYQRARKKEDFLQNPKGTTLHRLAGSYAPTSYLRILVQAERNAKRVWALLRRSPKWLHRRCRKQSQQNSITTTLYAQSNDWLKMRIKNMLQLDHEANKAHRVVSCGQYEE